MLTDNFVIFDRARQTLRICVDVHIGEDPAGAYKAAFETIERIVEMLKEASVLRPVPLRES